ncbi:MAG: hypothetical protein K0S44_3126, partial [Bacteroidetes bacterium]|nr:hypothetical protein [Bacteroidota bacterium]
MKPQTPSKILSIAALSAALLVFVAWIGPDNYYQLMTDNELTRSLKKKLSEYNEKIPEDR